MVALGTPVGPQAGEPVRPRPDWAGLACAAIIAAGTIAVYWRTMSVPLLFDDSVSITDNPTIRRLWPVWPALSPPDEAGVGGRPLLNLSYALNYAAGGTAVQGYHLVNLAIHALAAVTLFAIVRRSLLRPVLAGRFGPYATPLALSVGAIWAWHPVLTESVTYVSQRAESLMGLFYLLTVYCFIRGAQAGARGACLAWFAFSVLTCAAGAATKEVMVTAPLMVFLYDRTFFSGSFSAAWRRRWPLYLALASTLLLLGHRVVGLSRGSLVYGVGFGGSVAWWDYGLTECRAVVRYALLSFWPSPLVFDYGRSAPCRLSEVWPYAVALASLLAATAVALRRLPAVGFAAAWFFLILAPTSSIVPVVGQSMAESRMYLSLAGAVALAVLGAFAAAGRVCLPVLALAAAGLGFASFQRNGDYASEQALWRDTVAKNPANARAHGNLAKALAATPGGVEAAIAQYEEAARLDPAAAEVRNNLGNLLLRIPGRLDDAIAQYEAALRIGPDDAVAHYNLACALAKDPGRLDEAIAQYREALRLDAGLAAAHYNLANALSRLPGLQNDAIGEYEAALRLRPAFAEAHLGLAMALLGMSGHGDEARAHLREVLRLQPANDEARRLLGGSTHPESQ
jgi:protein O-mannosyl-transferase